MVTQIQPLPQGKTTSYTLSSNAVDQTPTLGGPSQRIARMGDRWTIAFNGRPNYYNQAVEIVATLIQGLSGKIRAYIPQPGVNVNVGTAITFVNAAAAAGTSIALTGFNAGAVIQPGQFFNVVTGGVAYLYQTSSLQTATQSGTATISFQPMLKAVPSAGDHIEFVAPVIEGFLSGNQQAWQVTLVQAVGLDFSIKEAQ